MQAQQKDDNPEATSYLPESLRYKPLKEDIAFTSTAEPPEPTLRQKAQRTMVFYQMNAQMYKKYSSSQNYYYIRDINDIIGETRTQAVILYKQTMDFQTEGEQIKKYVDSQSYPRKMRGLVDYYRYHKEIPRVFAKSVYDLYFDHHDRKRKVEYVIITRNLKNSKNPEDPVAAEEKLKRMRSKRFDPMLKALPQYSFNQRYYHHRNEVEKQDDSKSFYSIFDKLNRVVNSSKLSNQSFMQSESNVPARVHEIGFNSIDNEQKAPKAVDHKIFNFLKKKDPLAPVILPGTAPAEPRKKTPGLHKTAKDLKIDLEEPKQDKKFGLLPTTGLEQQVQPIATRVVESRERELRKSDVLCRPRLNDLRTHSKEESARILPNHTKLQGTQSFKMAKRQENDKKKVSRERKELEGGSLCDKVHWRSLERSAPADEENSQKVRSQSKKKRRIGDGLKRSINFNFNWTKVNKILTNPLLINKSLGLGKAQTQRDKVDQPVQQSKNYLNQKSSKMAKGYHHKVNSMLMTHINNDLLKMDDKNRHKQKISEADLFSRKNSLSEMEMKALLTSRQLERQPKPKFISHSKKNSVYNISNPNAMKKRNAAYKKKKKKSLSGLYGDSRTLKTFNHGPLFESVGHENTRLRASRTGTTDVKATHKHTKSEPETIFQQITKRSDLLTGERLGIHSEQPQLSKKASVVDSSEGGRILKSLVSWDQITKKKD